MKQVAVLSDVHGNSVALAAVLAEIEGVEELAEMMLTPPEPREVIDHAEQVVFAG